MKTPEPSLRRQLLEAREQLQRQIEILKVGPTGPNMAFQPGMIERLQNLLDEIDQQLSTLEEA